MKIISSITLAAAAVIVSLEGQASASSRFYDLIPASACQIRDNEDIGKADLVDGSWQINPGITGDVELLCPLRIPKSYRAPDDSPTELFWGFLDVFFRDIDGVTMGSYVDWVVYDVKASVVTAIHSNNSLNNPPTSDTLLESLMEDVPINGDFNHVVVLLRQGSGTNRVRLSAIHFWIPSPG